MRAGVAAADQAIKLYRDRHRGAMMERASKAFSEISRGAYRGLAAEPDGAERDADRARRATAARNRPTNCRRARASSFISRFGSRAIHELARARRPAPFVADDIMETFDHFRAEEALKLFADMGRMGR